MLLRFDPFQEFERLTEEARRPARTMLLSEKSKQRKISVGGGSGGSEAIDASSSDAEQGDDS